MDRRQGANPAVYTVNDPAQASKMAKSGVRLFYTDFLAPSDLAR